MTTKTTLLTIAQLAKTSGRTSCQTEEALAAMGIKPHEVAKGVPKYLRPAMLAINAYWLNKDLLSGTG